MEVIYRRSLRVVPGQLTGKSDSRLKVLFRFATFGGSRAAADPDEQFYVAMRLTKSLGQLFCGQQLSIKVSFGRGQVCQPIVKILCLRNGCTNRSFQIIVYGPIDRLEFLRNVGTSSPV